MAINESTPKPITEHEQLARYIKKCCIEAAQEAHEDARMAGLCGEGASEAALSAIQSLNTEQLCRAFREQQR